jgi:hypothetical protein
VRMVARRWVDFALFVVTTAKTALIAKQETDSCPSLPSIFTQCEQTTVKIWSQNYHTTSPFSILPHSFKYNRRRSRVDNHLHSIRLLSDACCELALYTASEFSTALSSREIRVGKNPLSTKSGLATRDIQSCQIILSIHYISICNPGRHSEHSRSSIPLRGR